ncbi:MAG: L-seryl-tRNA(Sec) selenium transferase [Acidobacteria bacterium]|nr:L-seryl-tRNA(Sec) selenium transferase [Acidobacteriota bacterium]
MNGLLRALPSVHELLDEPEILELASRTSRDYARERLRSALDELRSKILDNALDVEPESLAREALARATSGGGRPRPSLRRVINATGVVLHTNLGRAPLSDRSIEAIVSVARGASNLEFDIETGTRGHRDAHCESMLVDLLGCEAAVVVNNNAAAVLLVLNTLARGGEVIVSRGELVEIGGSFRVPEVLERAGCTLREVGTTNRTHLADYERAITERTSLLLRVHPSNYRIVGFASRVAAGALAELGRRSQLPVVDDLGSGCLIDPAALGVGDEPRVQDVLADGVDIVTFSGDKLLGGPQCGVIAGRAEYVNRIRRNPLMRALRVDKMVYAGLGATLAAYVEGRAEEEVPSIRMLTASVESVRARAVAFAARLNAAAPEFGAEVLAGRSVPGAGSAPGLDLPTALVVLDHPSMPAGELDALLRASDPPIVGRIEHDSVVIDLRTVRPDEEGELLEALLRLA